MKKPDYRYDDIGPQYFAELCGGEVLSCEQAGVHNEHQSSPSMSRWRVVYRKDGSRHAACFDLPMWAPREKAVIHGSINFQEIGFRKHPGFPPMWCLFDWETAQRGPIHFDLARKALGL